MPEHVSETCNEGNGIWLPLTEYSVRSGISLSTIRRKIKSNSIPFRLESGRYLILLDGNKQFIPKPEAEFLCEAPKKKTESTAERAQVRPRQSSYLDRINQIEQMDTLPLVERSVSMVSDAFEHALKEKDKRIRLLEKRNSDLQERLDELRLLVQVLEEKYEVRY